MSPFRELLFLEDEIKKKTIRKIPFKQHLSIQHAATSRHIPCATVFPSLPPIQPNSLRVSVLYINFKTENCFVLIFFSLWVFVFLLWIFELLLLIFIGKSHLYLLFLYSIVLLDAHKSVRVRTPTQLQVERAKRLFSFYFEGNLSKGFVSIWCWKGRLRLVKVMK